MGLSLTVKNQHELRRVAGQLRRGKGIVRKELTTAFKNAGDDTLREVRRNVQTMPMKGFRTRGRVPFPAGVGRGTRIRQRTARVTELTVSTSAGDPRVKFEVHANRLGDAHRLPGYF